MRRLRVVAVAVVAAAAASTASGQDLIVNGHFHTNINGWAVLIGIGTQAWDPLDWQGNPGSGSLRLANTNPAGNQATVSGQCIPLTPSGTYEAGGHVRFPSGQTILGLGGIGVAWYDNVNCTDPALSQANTPPILSTNVDTWIESFASNFTAPPGAVAVGVGAAVVKLGAGGQLEALFDRVRFGPVGTTPVTLESFTVE